MSNGAIAENRFWLLALGFSFLLTQLVANHVVANHAGTKRQQPRAKSGFWVVSVSPATSAESGNALFVREHGEELSHQFRIPEALRGFPRHDVSGFIVVRAGL